MITRSVILVSRSGFLLLLLMASLGALRAQNSDYILPLYHDTVRGQIIDQSWDTAFSQIGFRDTYRNDTLTYTPYDISGFWWGDRHFATNPLVDGRNVFLEEVETGCMSLWLHPINRDYYLRKGEHPVHRIEKEKFKRKASRYTKENFKLSNQIRSGKLPYDSLESIVQQYNQWLAENDFDCQYQEPFGFVKWWKQAAPYIRLGGGSSWFQEAAFQEEFHGGVNGHFAVGLSPFANRVFVDLTVDFDRYATRNPIRTQSFLTDLGFGGRLSYHFPLSGDRYVNLFGGYGVSSFDLTAQECDCNDNDFEVATGNTSGYVAGLTYQTPKMFLELAYHGKEATVDWNAAALVAANEKGYNVTDPAATQALNRLTITLGFHLHGKNLINLKY